MAFSRQLHSRGILRPIFLAHERGTESRRVSAAPQLGGRKIASMRPRRGTRADLQRAILDGKSHLRVMTGMIAVAVTADAHPWRTVTDSFARTP